jgi:Ribonuclease G/E
VSVRRLYLDDAPGERRGVVTLDGLTERLLIERFDDLAIQQPGARAVARVRRVERGLKSAFLDLGEGPDAMLPLSGVAQSVTEGAWLEVEIVAAARGDKGAVARMIGAGAGPCRLLVSASDLRSRLQAFAPGVALITGTSAREAADVAEDAALNIEHPLPSGGRIFIEPTQALTAIDVDLGSASGESRQATARANKEALPTAARLLRLKSLGGLVAIDLAGKGHDGAALFAIAKAAFAVDGEGVSIGPISRFGVMELSLPRTMRPIADVLLGRDGQISGAAMAYRLLRVIERAAGPGLRVDAVCAPEVAAIAMRSAPALTDRIGARFVITADPSKLRTETEVTAR